MRARGWAILSRMRNQNQGRLGQEASGSTAHHKSGCGQQRNYIASMATWLDCRNSNDACAETRPGTNADADWAESKFEKRERWGDRRKGHTASLSVREDWIGKISRAGGVDG